MDSGFRWDDERKKKEAQNGHYETLLVETRGAVTLSRSTGPRR
jgi:hypothetical protein